MSAPPPPLPRPSRIFLADDIVSGRVDLRGFPFRYIIVTPSAGSSLTAGLGGRSGVSRLIDVVLSAAELLETQGWELFSLDHVGAVAYLRRR